MVENTVLLVPVLRHLHIELVHVVTSELQLKRATACIDDILSAVSDMNFKVMYHSAPDQYINSARSRLIREKLESRILWHSKQAIEDAIDQQRKNLQQSKSHYPSIKRHSVHSNWGVESTRGATRIGSRTSTATFSNDPSRSHYGV